MIIRMCTEIREHVVRDFMKVVIVCSEEPHAVGDLPGLPYCFGCDKSLSIGDVVVCYSNEISLPSGGRVVIEGTKVLGEIRSISYIVKGIECSIDPEKLYEEVVELVEKLCSNMRSPSDAASE